MSMIRSRGPIAATPPGIITSRGSVRATLRRGLRLSPEFRQGLGVTLVLAVLATGGRVIVPVTVQQVLDRGLGAETGVVDLRLTVVLCVVALGIVVVTTICAMVMNTRLTRAAETALAALRVRAFRHIHDLSALTIAAEHRGGLVSRVTSDIDTISQFMQWGGVVLLVSVAQLLLAGALMGTYSWRLALVVIAVFAVLPFLLAHFQRSLSLAYAEVRRRVGTLLARLSESVLGAETVRAYGISERTNRRVAEAAAQERDTRYGAARTAALMFSSGELFAAAATTAVVVVGATAGIDWGMTAGQVVAFLFLVTLFVGPVQVATEVLDQAQTAVAGWRRVLDVLDTPADIADPGADGLDIPPGPITARFADVGFTYPVRSGDDDAFVALTGVTLDLAACSRVAVVGETGSGKTTFAKLLTRLIDPTSGTITLNGVALDQARFASLRRRVVMVPQDGFLFDATIRENIAHGAPDADDEAVRGAVERLGLADWVAALPAGLDTRTGERGTHLSAGERQLVALVRAYVADPDLLVLDEATSAVDPLTEVRLQRALEQVMQGRTTVAIAHRLSTAEAADEVVVFDGGRVVQRGAAARLRTVEGPYARLYRSWLDAGHVQV